MYKFPTPQNIPAEQRRILVRRPRPQLDELVADIDRIVTVER